MASPEPQEPFPIPPNPSGAALLTSTKPEMEWKNIANSDFFNNLLDRSGEGSD